MVAPGALYVALELGAEVSVGDVAGEASVDLVAGPVVASAFGDGGDGVVEVGVGHFWYLFGGCVSYKLAYAAGLG